MSERGTNHILIIGSHLLESLSIQNCFLFKKTKNRFEAIIEGIKGIPHNTITPKPINLLQVSISEC